MDVMLDVPNLGFLDETFNALVTGITNVSRDITPHNDIIITSK